MYPVPSDPLQPQHHAPLPTAGRCRGCCAARRGESIPPAGSGKQAGCCRCSRLRGVGQGWLLRLLPAWRGGGCGRQPGAQGRIGGWRPGYPSREHPASLHLALQPAGLGLSLRVCTPREPPRSSTPPWGHPNRVPPLCTSVSLGGVRCSRGQEPSGRPVMLWGVSPRSGTCEHGSHVSTWRGTGILGCHGRAQPAPQFRAARAGAGSPAVSFHHPGAPQQS